MCRMRSATLGAQVRAIPFPEKKWFAHADLPVQRAV